MLKYMFMVLSLLMLPTLTTNYFMVMSISLITVLPLMVLTLLPVHSYSFISCIYATDSMSSLLIILTLWVTVMMGLASTKIIFTGKQPKLFMLMTTLLLFFLMNCFASPSVFMFYVWFEASLIPTMILIMSWGYQPERSQASMYLMVYTVSASLPMLAMLWKISLLSKTPMMPMFSDLLFPVDVGPQWLACLVLLMGFLVKLPMFMVHLWLPKAHVEAPVAGSMVLAAILLKLGGYGMLRMITLFTQLSKQISNCLMSVALMGAAITGMICLRQTDLKSLIAYSSVGHMGLLAAGAISSHSWGMQAALIMMVAHAMSSSALFALANMNYEVTHTRSIILTKGLMVLYPTITLWWFLFTIMNMAAPPSINLLSEIMLITSILSSSPSTAALLAVVSFLTVAYSLFLYTSMNHGPTSSLANPLPSYKIKDFTLLTMHLAPALAMIAKPEMISNWL